MSDTTMQDRATVDLSKDQPFIQRYYVVRQAPHVKKISLGYRPLREVGSRITTDVAAEYRLTAAFDFNNDGNPDLLGHHQVSGEVRIWWGIPRGDFVVGVAGSPVTTIRPDWQLQVGRFRRGEGVDIFGHNRGSDPREAQMIRVWHLHYGEHIGTSFTSGEKIGLEWELHLGDFDGDGILDILGVQRNTGELYVWFVREAPDGTLNLSDVHYRVGQIGRAWQLQVADIDGDGYADIFGYDADNLLWVWNNREGPDGRRVMDGGHRFGKLGTAWGSLQVTYLDGNGFPDLLGQSTSGALRGWYSNGTALDGGSEVGFESGWTPLGGGSHLR